MIKLIANLAYVAFVSLTAVGVAGSLLDIPSMTDRMFGQTAWSVIGLASAFFAHSLIAGSLSGGDDQIYMPIVIVGVLTQGLTGALLFVIYVPTAIFCFFGYLVVRTAVEKSVTVAAG